VYWWGWAQVSSFQYSSFGLEWLDVMCCYPITSLRIPCLQHLSYLGISCNEKYMVQSIQIKAPNLSSFYFQDEIWFLLLLGETMLQIKKFKWSARVPSFMLLLSFHPACRVLKLLPYFRVERYS
jgi:hypothetical protein